MLGGTQTHIYVHIIWCTAQQKAILSPVVRRVLFPYLLKSSPETGLQLVTVNGHAEHIHGLVKLTPYQTLQEVVKQLKQNTATYLQTAQLVTEPIDWEADYIAYSVSASALGKAIEYIDKQETYHQTKTFDEEKAIFQNMVQPIL